MWNEDPRCPACLLYPAYMAEAFYFATLLASSSLGLSSAICLTEPNVELNFLDLKVDTSRR